MTRHRLRPLSLSVAVALIFMARSAQGSWPSLAETYQRARAAAPDVIRARGDVSVAQSAGVGARMSSVGNPYFELYADRRTSGEGLPGIGVSGILWLPFEVAGQRSSRIAEANSLLEWQKIRAFDASGRAVGAAIASYGEALVATARVKQAQFAEIQAQAELTYFAGRADVGDATTVDRSLAEAEVARYAQLRAEAKIALVRAREQVAILTATADIDFPPENVATDPPALRADSAVGEAKAVLANSPLLKALETEARYHAHARERASAERSPPISAILTAGRGEFGDARVGGGIAWTIPVLRRNEGEIARAIAEEGRATGERSSWMTFLEVRARADVDAYKQTMEAIASLDRAGLPATLRVVESTQSAFRAGKVEMIRVITARRDLAVARARRLDLVEGAWRAYGDLAALRGDLP